MGDVFFGSISVRGDDGNIAEHKIAVKMISVQSSNWWSVPREMAAMNAFSHPNVIKPLFAVEGISRVGYAMEIMASGNLRDVIQSTFQSTKRYLDETTIRHFMLPIISAVNFMHKCGWTHRDIKPGNILVQQKEFEGGQYVLIPYLADFGCAAYGKDTNWGLGLRGDLAYSPPEYQTLQLWQVIRDARPADMYGIFLIMIEMASGWIPTRPYEGLPDNVWIWMGSHFSQAFMTFLHSLGQADPSQRMTAQQARADPWLKQ